MSFNEQDDDFADFQNCTFEQVQTETNCVSNKHEDNENHEDEDFADFQNADLARIDKEQIETTNADHRISSSSINENTKFESILKDAFPNLEHSNNVNKENEETAIISELFTDEYKRSLWNQIQNLEESPSLKLRWNKTQSFQHFLSALRINSRNMLSNPHVPIFACSLGFLVPTKLKPNTDNEPKEHFSTSNHLRSNESEISTNSLHSNNDKNLESISSQNCLSSTNQICDDFDKFDSLKQNDQPINGLIKPNSSYDKMAKNIKQPDNQKKTEEVNSDSNSKILDELPILNFMRSNTLMFNGQ